jgi:hypothetical protein
MRFEDIGGLRRTIRSGYYSHSYKRYRNDKALEEAARLDKLAREEHRTTQARQV